MDTIIYILLGVILAILAILLVFLLIYLVKTNRKRNDGTGINNGSSQLFEQQVKPVQDQLTNLINGFANINGSVGALKESLDGFKTNSDKQDSDLNSKLEEQKNYLSKSLTNVLVDLENLKKSTQTLTAVDEKIKNLNDVFLNSKKTGNLGEFSLEIILTDIFGSNRNIWERQYKLDSGGIVDFFIKTDGNKEGIAIDSKFPLENYKRYFAATEKANKDRYLADFKTDLKKQVNEVAKYINIKNKISSAIMYLPSEGIFSFVYEEFQDEVVNFAFKKRVWLTSPTTVSAILFVIHKHLKDVEFNQTIEDNKMKLKKIKEQFDRWIERWKAVLLEFKKVNKTIDDLNITHENINKQYQKIWNDQLVDENED